MGKLLKSPGKLIVAMIGFQYVEHSKKSITSRLLENGFQWGVVFPMRQDLLLFPPERITEQYPNTRNFVDQVDKMLDGIRKLKSEKKIIPMPQRLLRSNEEIIHEMRPRY